MNKSQRIYINSGSTGNQYRDNFIKVKLEQDVDTLEFMSLKIGTADAYQNFNSDYGVLVGRVIANNGIGIENAKISVFIPLDDDDVENAEVYNIYPYKTPRDKNNEGKRYNLLPRVGVRNVDTGIINPKQAFGSFPIKEEVLANESTLNVYKKYYKYTAVTNGAGDYMIFGLPVGTQTIHLSCDITDIGKYSMNPAAMVTNLGYSPNLFTDNNTKIKPSDDLNDLPHIETQEITVDVRPFWGNVDDFEIGITRQDFRIRSVLKNVFTIFGSVFTDGDGDMWGNTDSDDKKKVYRLYQHSSLTEGTGIKTKRVGKVTEKIYYYPNNISDNEISTGDYTDQMLLLDKSEYSFYKENGDFVLIINCNRDKIIINDNGDETPVDDSYNGGIYSTFRGFMTLEITGDDLNLDWTRHGQQIRLKPIRQILKFPQGSSFDWDNKIFSGLQVESDSTSINHVNEWRQQHYKFEGGKIYSVAKFHALVFNQHRDAPITKGYIKFDEINHANRISTDQHIHSINVNTGIIQTGDEMYSGNTYYQMQGNSTTDDNTCVFGANWLNMSIYLPQTAYVYNNYSRNTDSPRSNSQFAVDLSKKYPNQPNHFFRDNDQNIAGVYTNTCSFARSDYNWTDFIEVDKDDIIQLNNAMCCNEFTKGVKADDQRNIIVCDPNGGTCPYELKGKYRNGVYLPPNNGMSWSSASPSGGGRLNGDCNSNYFDGQTYFFKGFDSSNAISYVINLGVV